MGILSACPFCGADPVRSGDYLVSCKCGASMELYNYNGSNDRDGVVDMWNERSINLEPIINKISSLQGQESAYTDLCAANFKINKV